MTDNEIREILAKRIDQQKQSVGIAVGVIDPNGRRVITHGRPGANHPRPLDGGTIFEIGSITKVFTSLVLADMVKRGEVALDDPAAKYLPAQVKMPDRGGRPITLLDLSTHSSGLPRLPGNLKPKDPRNPHAGYSVDELYQFLSGYTLPRDPGSEIEYSNLGAGLLGHILALRAGTDYENLIRTRIAEPLGMPDTRITPTPSMRQRMATGHNPMLTPTVNWDFPTLAGAGALRSSVHDMLTLLEACLGYKKTPLAPAMKAMLEGARPLGQGKLGLGWFIFPSGGREIANHDGGTGGFCSWTGYDPKERMGVVVLANTFSRSGVVDIGLHLFNPQEPLADIEPPPQRTAIPIDPALLDRYIGRYQLAPERTLEVIREGDRLFVQVSSASLAGPKFEILAASENSFFNSVTGSQIAFEIGPDGRAASLKLRPPGREPTLARRVP